MHKLVNDFYFHEINTEEKAYWLGYLMADGAVRSPRKGNNTSFEISLCSIDMEHIQKFKTAIYAEHKISCIHTKNKPIFRIQFCSTQMANDLKLFGIVPNKTYTKWTLPNLGNLTKHFIRGFIDGDGCITRDKGTNKHYIGACCFHREPLKQIVNWIENNYYIKPPKITKQENKWGHAYVFRYSGNHIVNNVLDMLYADSSTFLLRKKTIFTQFKTLYRNSQLQKKNKYIGVQQEGKCYKVKIKHNGKVHYIGSFQDEISAAKAYDKKALILKGKYWRLNFQTVNDPT